MGRVPETELLPSSSTRSHSRAARGRLPALIFSTLAVVVTCVAYVTLSVTGTTAVSRRIQRVPLNADAILSQCAALHDVPGPPSGFLVREASDRFEPGTRPTLIKNASIWTGTHNGTDVVYGDIFLDKGIVKAIGYVRDTLYANRDVDVYDAGGGWITPGLVDLHSHVGLLSAPFTRGAFDVNSRHGPVLPWLRSIDGFDTHDDAFRLAIVGGLTSVQVLPGSGNAIGGQAFIFKLRRTSDKSPTSMILEPPHNLNGTHGSHAQPLRWRHMKQACGENLRRYGNRMDAVWSFRSAYNEARKMKNAQDAYCARAEAGQWDAIQGQSFPESLQWEALVDVLRGRVKISNHCYEAVDLDDIVRLTQEFEFPIASFHHASEAWLVPDVLKKTWGGTPAIAIFASNHRYKRESYRGSEFAARVLADNDIPVVMKSDHPVLHSRYLLYEAQQAHYYGLPAHLAMSAVTSVPAAAAGLEHRIGILQMGADADVVLWDSHPLRLGATPRKVWIDGILQLGADGDGIVTGGGKNDPASQQVPSVPNWDTEREEAVRWEGLPPLGGQKRTGRVVFKNVSEVIVRGQEGAETLFKGDSSVDVVVNGGRVACVGGTCVHDTLLGAEVEVDLQGGSVVPGLMSFGSPLGIEEIAGEPSTGDGSLYDPFSSDVPGILGDKGSVVRAADALQFETRNARVAHRAGVTHATSSLAKSTLFAGSPYILAGLSATFRTGSAHALESGAIIRDITALHVVVGRTPPFADAPRASVSTQIAALRRLLLGGESEDTETGYWFRLAAQGEIPLVVEVASADIMAALLTLKEDIARAHGPRLRLVFFRATEAHLIAEHIARANVGVILEPARPFPQTWDDRRILAGPPITNDTAIVTLMEAGVTVAIGVRDAWQAANARFDAAWAALESNGRISRDQARALVSTNLERLLGVDRSVGRNGGDLVAYQGGDPFDFTGKPVAVVSPERGLVELF